MSEGMVELTVVLTVLVVDLVVVRVVVVVAGVVVLVVRVVDTVIVLAVVDDLVVNIAEGLLVEICDAAFEDVETINRGCWAVVVRAVDFADCQYSA